jgi:hypothetical protein
MQIAWQYANLSRRMRAVLKRGLFDQVVLISSRLPTI